MADPNAPRVLSDAPPPLVVRHMRALVQAFRAVPPRLLEAASAVADGTPATLLGYANMLLELKRPREALESFEQLLAREPNHLSALNNCAIALIGLGRANDALAPLDKAIALQPHYAQAHNNRGLALVRLGRPEEALACFDRAIAIQPGYADALNNRGVVLQDRNRLDEALASFDQAIAARPRYADAHNNRGVVLRRLARLEEALGCFDQVLATDPNCADALNNRGNVLNEQRRFDMALASFDRAIAARPDHHQAHSNRGNALAGLKRFDQAWASYEKAVAIKPDYVEAIHNSGSALSNLNRIGEALARYDKALAIRPDYPEAWKNRGIALQGMGRLTEAMQSFDRAIELDRDQAQAHWSKAICTLLCGNLKEGLALYEWRKRLPVPLDFRDFPEPPWTGKEELSGTTLFVHHDQGLGDAIQFIRYARLAAARGARVVVSVQHSLVRLLRSAYPALEIVDSTVVPPFDHHIALMSLPLAFATTLQTIPAVIPYLKAEPRRVRRWASRIGQDGFRIAICWQGNPRSVVDLGRSPALSHFRGLAAIPGVRLISLQRGEGVDQIRHLPAGMKLQALGRRFDEPPHAFLDSAAVIENVDLVISSDTAIAHLAGAMGRPTWLVLKSVPDWRWFLDRPDSPWYPGMRLFRQPSPGDWASVFGRLEAEVVRLVARRVRGKRRRGGSK